MNDIIKVGFCVAYDWELLKTSLPLVYKEADAITLSIDTYRKTWSGTSYHFDNDAFFAFVKSIDVQNKITIFEDVFSDTKNTSIQNDNLQRNLMGQSMGKNGWHIQIDSDEYFLDFKGFVDYLKQHNPNPKGSDKPINIWVNLIPLIKKTDKGYIYVKNSLNKLEGAPFATNVPIYESARRNGHFNHVSPYLVFHETWAREEEELKRKLQNWGHNTDFNTESYFNLWKALDEFNIKYIKNVHPIVGEAWAQLDFGIGQTVEEFIQNFVKKNPYQLSKSDFYWQNHRNWQRLKSLLNR